MAIYTTSSDCLILGISGPGLSQQQEQALQSHNLLTWQAYSEENPAIPGYSSHIGSWPSPYAVLACFPVGQGSAALSYLSSTGYFRYVRQYEEVEAAKATQAVQVEEASSTAALMQLAAIAALAIGGVLIIGAIAKSIKKGPASPAPATPTTEPEPVPTASAASSYTDAQQFGPVGG